MNDIEAAKWVQNCLDCPPKYKMFSEWPTPQNTQNSPIKYEIQQEWKMKDENSPIKFYALETKWFIQTELNEKGAVYK